MTLADAEIAVAEVHVSLLPWEIELAQHAAKMRSRQNVERGAKHRFGAEDDGDGGYDMHLTGTLGEIAAAKWCNFYWSGGWGEYNAPDVGHALGVRARSRIYHDKTLVYAKDKPDLVIISAAAIRERLPVIVLKGWLYAREGQDDRYLWTPPGKKPDRRNYFYSGPLRKMGELRL